MSKQAALFICGARRGRYGPPVPFRSAFTRSSIRRLQKARCDGCRRRFRLGYMYVRKWNLTPEELEEVIADHDIMSLEVLPKLLCRKCKRDIEQVDEANEPSPGEWVDMRVSENPDSRS